MEHAVRVSYYVTLVGRSVEFNVTTLLLKGEIPVEKRLKTRGLYHHLLSFKVI